MSIRISPALWIGVVVLLIAAHVATLVYWHSQLRQVESTQLSAVSSATPPSKPAPISAVTSLFGTALAQKPEQGSAAEVKPSTLSLKLFASYVMPDSKRSAAIISSDGDNQKLYYLGDRIQQGVELKAIHADRILVKRNGVLESISLENIATDALPTVEKPPRESIEVAATEPVAKPASNQANPPDMLEQLKKLKSLAAGNN